MAVKYGTSPNRSIHDPEAYRWEYDRNYPYPRGTAPPKRRRRAANASAATKSKRAQRDRWEPVRRKCDSLRRSFKLKDKNGKAACENAAVLIKRFEKQFGFRFGKRRPLVGERCRFIPLQGKRALSELKAGRIFAIHYNKQLITGKTIGVPVAVANEYHDKRTFVFISDNNNKLIGVPMSYVTALTDRRE